MSFTTCALLPHHSQRLANLYAELGDWKRVRAQVLEQNLLQMRTLNSSKRVFRELRSRVVRLTDDQFDFLLTAAPPELYYILWLAFCKRYTFVRDFAVEVINEKVRGLQFELTYDDYDIFFYRKAEWHPEVDGVAEATRKRQRSFLFQILRETEMLTRDNRLLPIILSPAMEELITADDPALRAVFTVR